MYPVRTQARGLIVHHGHIALVRIRKRGMERWVLPGGGQDAGEALHDTVRRECLEELGLRIHVQQLCLVREFVPANHERARSPFDAHCIDFVFRCTVDASSNASGSLAGMAPDHEALEARWVAANAAPQLPLYPECLRELLPALLHDDRVHYVGDRL